LSEHLGEVKCLSGACARTFTGKPSFAEVLRDMAPRTVDSILQVVCFQRLGALHHGTPRALLLLGVTMIELEVHPEIHGQAQVRQPTYSTCRECHRSFHAKPEDQLSLELSDSCLHALRFPEEAIPTAHIKVLPRNATNL
jgi:hypothetical protein